MKNLLFTFLLLLTINVSAQDTIVSTLEKESMSFQEAVKPYIERLVNGLETGVDFAVRETPIVIQQYLMYEAIFYWFWVLLSFIMIVGAWRIRSNIIKESIKFAENTIIDPELEKWRQAEIRERISKKLDDSKEYGSTMIILISLLAFIIFIITIFSAIKVTFFPKLYLVQEFINLF